MFRYHEDPAIAAAARDSLWIVTAISNPERYRARYELYKDFRHHVLGELQGNLLTVECAHGDRAHQVTGPDAEQPREGSSAKAVDVQVRNKSHVWLKECLLNLGVARLPASAKYIFFCDADVRFQNPHVLADVVHGLQIHRVVQPFESALDMGPHGEVLDVHKSFAWCLQQGMEWNAGAGEYGVKARRAGGYKGLGNVWHPGFALCFRRETLEGVHGLPEVGVLGAGDHHCLTAIIGHAADSMPGNIHPNYRAQVLGWQERATKVIKGDIGCVRGCILHSFHGAKHLRYYKTRWQILTRNGYDPATDVYKNLQGVLELRDDKPALRDEIRRYFAARKEDSSL